MDGFETNRLLERIRSLEVENGLLKKRLEEAGISYDDITGAGPGFNIPTDESPDDPDNHYDPDQGDRIHPFEVTDKVANTFFMMFCRGRKDVYDLRYTNPKTGKMYYLIMILMKPLSASEEEIDRFRRKHMNFQSVRKYYVKKALEEGDAEEEIRLLKQGKKLDSESAFLVHS